MRYIITPFPSFFGVATSLKGMCSISGISVSPHEQALKYHVRMPIKEQILWLYWFALAL
jgi:hypothetical protein